MQKIPSKVATKIKINVTTKQIAMVAIFSAVYTVLRLMQTIPMIGVEGGRFSASDVVAPIYGIVLGPYLGGASVILGSFLAIAMGRPVTFLFLDFLPALVNTVALGFLVRRKWLPVVILYAALLIGFFVNPLTTFFINIGEFAIPFAWLHIAAFILLVSPLGYKAGKWVTDIPEEGLKKETAAYLLSITAGCIGIIIGAFLIVTSYLLPSLISPPTIWMTIGLLSVICGLILMFASTKVNANPEDHKKLGVTIIVFSVIGLGTIFGIVGGIFAFKYKPQNIPSIKTRITKSSKFIAAFIMLAVIGTMMQHLMGNILTEVVMGQIVQSMLPSAFVGMWNAVFFVYPWERLILVLLAVIVGVPLVRVLFKTSLFRSVK